MVTAFEWHVSYGGKHQELDTYHNIGAGRQTGCTLPPAFSSIFMRIGACSMATGRGNICQRPSPPFAGLCRCTPGMLSGTRQHQPGPPPRTSEHIVTDTAGTRHCCAAGSHVPGSRGCERPGSAGRPAAGCCLAGRLPPDVRRAARASSAHPSCTFTAERYVKRKWCF
jgi:hypothetical protein